MTILDLPTDFKINTFKFGLETNTRQSISPFNGVTQTKELAGAVWGAQFDLVSGEREVTAPMRAFLLSLRGGAGRFWGFDVGAINPLGTGAGTPIVKGASQTGRQLITTGWQAGDTVLKAGDYVQVGRELKCLTEDATADVSGDAVLRFEPPLRISPADGVVLSVNKPSCVMRLVDDKQVNWTMDTAGFYKLSFNAVEVIE